MLGALVTSALVAGWFAAERWWGPDQALICPIAHDAEGALPAQAELWVSDPRRRAWTRWIGAAQGERFVFPEAPDEGQGELVVPGFVPAQVRWREGRCAPFSLIQAAPLVGSVHGIGAEPVLVMGCGAQTEVGPDGSFFLEVAPEPCALRVVRTDGLGGRGPAVKVRPQVGHDTVVDLVLPTLIGGIGIRFQFDDEGHAQIEGVFPGSPADQTELHAGQRILAVDGQPVQGMDLQELTRRIIGPVGSEVTLTLQSRQGARDLTLIRAGWER